jgi:hypothetical protein
MGVFFEWTVTPEQAFTGLTQAYITRIRQGVRDIARRRAPEIEAWMKVNAPWQNVTGLARQSLNVEVEEVSLDMVDIILSHGVEYGVFLELANAGRFSILAPAMDYFGPLIWQDVQQMLQ